MSLEVWTGGRPGGARHPIGYRMHSDHGARRFGPPHKFLEGVSVIIKCAHSDVVLYPLANVDMEVDGLKWRRQATSGSTTRERCPGV